MQLDFQGRTWQLDLDDINLKPAMVIQGYTGLSVNGFLDSLTSEADADGNVIKDATDGPGFLKSLAAVYWLMLQQNGETVPIADVDFPLGAFGVAFAEAMAAESGRQAEDAAEQIAAKAAADPTLTPGPSSASSPEPPSTPAISPPTLDESASPDG